MNRMLGCSVRMFAIATLMAAALLPSAAAAKFPDQNITLIVTFSPGGGYDSIARAIGRSMQKYLPKGVHVIVKNVTGAGGVRGTVAVYRAKPDGYTIGHLQSAGMLGLQILRGSDKVGYDMTNMSWLAEVGADAFGIIVAKKGPFKSLEDLQHAKRVRWGTTGIGAGRWFPEYFASKIFGIDFHVVAGYGGTGESLPGLIRGDFDAWAQPIDHPSVVPYLKEDLRPVVQLSDKRAINAPSVPTAKELGYDFVFADVRSMGGPPGIPADRQKILQDLLLKAMNDDEYKAFLAQSKIHLESGPGDEVPKEMKYYKDLYTKYREPMLEAIAGH
jgi:tripartite-type tricarboxylate transporter receptor subunit TctC